jgi:glycosyltransferase involved in cell wall biosynthesis
LIAVQELPVTRANLPNAGHPPLVTVVTPSYNQANFLEASVLSVLKQDYPNLEYLVVDGGSTDGSLEVIQRHADQLAWWVSEHDSGQAEAINKGLKRAHGEVLAWLNSDDLYLPGAVRTAVETLQANPQLGMVFGNAISIDANGIPFNQMVFGDWALEELLRFRIICQPAVFMRREFFEKAGFLALDYHYMLDHHLWLRVARHAPIQHISRFLAAARFHPSAKNVSQAPGFGQETLRLLDWLKVNPEFSHLVKNDRRRIDGGAYRLNARYLLDGRQYGPALHWYWKALLNYPGYTVKHWRRMLFALAGRVLGEKVDKFKASGPGSLTPKFTLPIGLSELPGIETWPGIHLA